MKFLSKEDVPAEFGPPGNSSLTNYPNTRYVEWTSWAAASTSWPNAGGGSSTQGESSGMATFAHELSHLLGIGDNYNNPYSDPPRRSYTGPWSMLSVISTLPLTYPLSPFPTHFRTQSLII